jgi:hypothetical protein
MIDIFSSACFLISFYIRKDDGIGCFRNLKSLSGETVYALKSK